MGSYRFLWIPMDSYVFLWISYGLWIPMEALTGRVSAQHDSYDMMPVFVYAVCVCICLM